MGHLFIVVCLSLTLEAIFLATVDILLKLVSYVFALEIRSNLELLFEQTMIQTFDNSGNS